MSDQLFTAITAIASALMTVFFVDRLKAQAALRSAKADETKSSGDAIEAATRANIALNDPLTKRVAALETKHAKMEAEIDALKKLNFDYLVGIKRLVRQILNARLQPVWVPDDFDWEDVVERAE
jgi:hypothetical protein